MRIAMRYLSAGAAVTTVVGVVVGTMGVTGAEADTSTAITGLAGKCVDVNAASSADRTPVQLFACNGTVAQEWSFHEDGTIRALGGCLHVSDGAVRNGAKVQLFHCDGTAAQSWVAREGTLVNVAAAKCLDVTDWGRADRTPLQVWSCTGAANQAWSFPDQQHVVTGRFAAVPAGPRLDSSLPPGGNFDLAIWRLELPIGRPGSPEVVPPSQLQGPAGYTNPAYSWTDDKDGAMTFWAPERGVNWAQSKYPDPSCGR